MLKGGEDLSKTFKMGKLASSTPKKIARVVLWILVAFLILRGIASIIKPNNSSKILDQVSSKLNSNSDTISQLNDAAAFAENFTKEYFTYAQTEGDGYRKRLLNYMSDTALTSVNLTQNSDIQATDTIVVHKEKYKENSYNVDIKVRVKYLAKNITKEIYVRVPVAENAGKYLVEDVPLLIGKQSIASISATPYSGNTADSGVTNSIKDMLNNFLKVYCEGSDSEIKYYLLNPNQDFKGLNGNVTFKNINDLIVYNMNGNYLVTLGFTVQDAVTQQDIKQKVNITITSKANRYYVKDMQTRTNNLKEEKNNEKN